MFTSRALSTEITIRRQTTNSVHTRLLCLILITTRGKQKRTVSAGGLLNKSNVCFFFFFFFVPARYLVVTSPQPGRNAFTPRSGGFDFTRRPYFGETKKKNCEDFFDFHYLNLLLFSDVSGVRSRRQQRTNSNRDDSKSTALLSG